MSTTPTARPARRGFDLFEWLTDHEAIVDAVAAAFAAIGVLFIMVASGSGVGESWVWWTLAMTATAAFVRTHTEVATLVMAILALAHFATGSFPLLLGDGFIFYALYVSVIRARPFALRLAVAAAIGGGFLVALYAGMQTMGTYGNGVLQGLAITAIIFTISSIVVLAVWALGRYQRVKVVQLRLARERASQAEREREQLAQLAVAAERSRIAREMHDVVAHSLSVIIAQADGGQYVATTKPEQAVEVLSTISQTGRGALTDMRRLLGVLRNEDGGERAPQPGLAQIPALCDTYRSSGLTVDLDIASAAAPRSPVIDLTIFRIVQESLTNVIKHAGTSARASVQITHGTHEWAVSVVNTAPAAGPVRDPLPSAGQGLRGMRERLRGTGGSLSASPTADGGFAVHATIHDSEAPPPSRPGLVPGRLAPSPPTAKDTP
ncbi:MAG: histidine kinase [Dermabacter sp.]|nr:histidine kinase [Dermabacter sp.]